MDPCDDFYQFANGGWLASHPVPAEKGVYGSAQWIDQRNKDLLKRILETPIEKNLASLGDSSDAVKEADRQNLKDLNAFYTSCMDEDALDRKGSLPLIKVVKDVLATWRQEADSQLSKAAERQKRITDTLLLLHSRGMSSTYPSELHTSDSHYYRCRSSLRLRRARRLLQGSEFDGSMAYPKRSWPTEP